MSESVTVQGEATFRATMARASHNIRDLEQADSAAGRTVQLRAAANAPKLSGALSRNISARTEDNEVTVSASLNYAAIQEFGLASHNIRAQPYMRPALEDSRAQVVSAYAVQVRKEVGSIRGA